MNQKQEITQLLNSSFRFQKLMFYGMGIVAAITGVVILIMSVTIPAKPGEETILQALQLVSIVFILFGFWSAWYVRQRIAKVTSLVFDHPQDIAEIKPVSVQKRGVVAYAIRIYTKDKKMVGFNVVGPKTQQRLVQLLSTLS